MEIDLELRLSIEGETLKVTVMNTGAREVKLWARDNAWGWTMLSLLVAPPGSDQWRELCAKLVRWSANLPRTVNIAAGAAHDFLLRRGDPAWEGADGVPAGGALQVRVRLGIDSTPEANAMGVFTGALLSPGVLSQPPHRWLA